MEILFLHPYYVGFPKNENGNRVFRGSILSGLKIKDKENYRMILDLKILKLLEIMKMKKDH